MQQSATETLTDVLIKFLDEVGFQSQSLAELAGRTVLKQTPARWNLLKSVRVISTFVSQEDNLLDAVAAIEDYGSSVSDLQVN